MAMALPLMSSSESQSTQSNPSSIMSTLSTTSSECGDHTPSYSSAYPFTLYQHKIVFDPPLDYAVSKYKILVEFAEYSPSICNGDILFMARAISPKNRVGYYYDPKNSKKTITWTCTYTSKVKKTNPMYHLFNELIFTPGVNMKVFNLENKSTPTCHYAFEKRFNTFSIIPSYPYYKTTIRFSGYVVQRPGLPDYFEVLFCSEFTGPKSPKQKCYDFVPDPRYCKNVKEHLMFAFKHLSDAACKPVASKRMVDKIILSPYSGKIYKIGHVDFNSSPTGTYKDRYNPNQLVSYIDHYKKKYDITLPQDDIAQIMLVAFPTKCEDVANNGKVDNFYLIPSLSYILGPFKKDPHSCDSG